MSSTKLLCRYQYDPLDRLTGLKPLERSGTQRFYQGNDLANEIEGQIQLTIFRHEAQPLAQRLSIANVTETTLLTTDQQHSVLQTRTATDTQYMAYTAYGHHPVESGLGSLLGFNGERADSITGHYLLGQGNRAFNPVLMRFNSPDELSPFGEGGVNAYAYCGNDPVNRNDPSGNFPWYVAKPWNFQKKQLTQIFRPWETALDLSSKPVTRTASAADPVNMIPILPPEGPPKRLRVEGDLLSKRLTDSRKLTADARLYDLLIKEQSPNSLMVPSLDYLRDFYSAEARLKTFPIGRSIKVKKQRNSASLSYNWARKVAKQNALYNAGIIRKS